jgi:hypothetical protein
MKVSPLSSFYLFNEAELGLTQVTSEADISNESPKPMVEDISNTFSASDAGTSLSPDQCEEKACVINTVVRNPRCH